MYSNKRKFGDIYFGEKKKKKIELDDGSDNSSEPDIIKSLSKKMDKESKIERDNNHIYFYSEVDRDSIYDLSVLIREAEEESILTSLKLNIDEIPIFLHISSFGGSVFAAFSAIDIIKACRVPIHTIIDGATASAGTLISIAGKKRYMRPRSHMLIHQLSSSMWGKFAELEDEFNNLKGLMENITDIYKEHANIPKKELAQLLKQDLWLNSDKCLTYGLVDALWTK